MERREDKLKRVIDGSPDELSAAQHESKSGVGRKNFLLTDPKDERLKVTLG